MLPVSLALLAAVSLGLSNYLGGLLSRRVNPLTMTVLTQVAGLIPAVLIVLVSGLPIPDLPLLINPLLSGLCMGVTLLALFKAMSLADISVVSPILASAVVLPVVVGLVGGEQATGLQLLGMVLTAAGVVLVSRRALRGPGRTTAYAGIGYALLAALGFGGFYTFLGLARGVDPAWSLVTLRVASALTAMTLLPFIPLTLNLPWRTLGSVVLVGLLATAAVLLIAVATTIGQLSTTSVLSSLNMLVPIVLSRIFLGERLARSQQIGAVTALGGVLLIASRL